MLGGQQWRRRPNRRRSQRRRRRLRKGLQSASRRSRPSSTSIFEADVTRAGDVEGLAQSDRLRRSPAQSTEGRRRDRSLSSPRGPRGADPSVEEGQGGCFSRSVASIAADRLRSPDLADALTSVPRRRPLMSERKASPIDAVIAGTRISGSGPGTAARRKWGAHGFDRMLCKSETPAKLAAQA